MSGLRLVDYISELSEPVLWILIILFVWRRTPSRTILRLYPFRVRLLWMLPLSNRWRDEVAPEHEEEIKKFRNGAFAYFTAMVVLSLLRTVYYWFFFVKLHGV